MASRVEIEIEISGIRYMLNTIDNEPIPLTFQIGDIQNIDATNSSYSKTIQLPDDENNRRVFGFISDLDVTLDSGPLPTLQQGGIIINPRNPGFETYRTIAPVRGAVNPYTYFNPNKKARCYVLCDSVIVMEGYLQLVKFVQNANTNNNRFECVIYSGNDNFWTKLSDNLLSDINWKKFNHIWSPESIATSWFGNADTMGYFYPLIDYGDSGAPQQGIGGDWTLQDMGGATGSTAGSYVSIDCLYPATYAKSIWDKIFQTAGYQYSSTFLNSDKFKSLIIPFNNANMTRPDDNPFTFRVGMGNVYTGPTGSAQTDKWDIQAAVPGYGTLPICTPAIPSGNANCRNIGGAGPSGTITLPGVGNIFGAGWGNVINYTDTGVRVRMADLSTPNSDGGSNYDITFWDYHQLYATSSNGNIDKLNMRFVYQYDIIEYFPTGVVNQNNLGQPTKGYLTFNRAQVANPNSPFRTEMGRPQGLTAAVPGDNTYYGIPDVGNPFGYNPVSNLNPTIRLDNGTDRLYLGDSTNNNQIVSDVTDPISGAPGKRYQGLMYTGWCGSNTARDLVDSWYTSDGVSMNYPGGYGVQKTDGLYGIRPGEHVWVTYNRQFTNSVAITVPTNLTTFTSGNTMWNEMQGDAIPYDMIDYNSVIPAGIKQSDFILSIIKMFNLFIEPDKTNPNMLKIEPRDDYYAQGTLHDWTDKLDVGQDLEGDILAETQNKITSFLPKLDSDYFNTDYNTTFNEIYGQYKYVFDNDFITGEKKIETIFASTPMVTPVGSRGFVIPKIVKWNNGGYLKTNSAPRILHRTPPVEGIWGSGLITNRFNEYWKLGVRSRNIVYDMGSAYPYAGHFDHPYDPTYDINWGQTRKLYYGQDNAINDNLVTCYWKKMLDEYDNVDSRIIIANMWLDPLDVSKFSFADQVLINNQYYKVIKIDGYDPSQKITCKVTLLKTLNITVPKAPQRAFVYGPAGTGLSPNLFMNNIGNTGLITAIGSHRNVILSSDSGSIGHNNQIGEGSPHVFVSGQDNIVEANNSNTIIHGSNNMVYASASSPFIKGDMNIVSPNGRATIFGNTNYVTDSVTASSYIVGNANIIGVGVQSNIFGSSNIIGTGSIAHIFGDNNNIITASVSVATYSIFIVGTNNVIAPTSTPYILGNNNTVGTTVSNTIVIGQNIGATKNDTVYVSDVIFTGGGTGSGTIGLANVLRVSNKTDGQGVIGTFSITAMEGPEILKMEGSVDPYTLIPGSMGACYTGYRQRGFATTGITSSVLVDSLIIDGNGMTSIEATIQGKNTDYGDKYYCKLYASSMGFVDRVEHFNWSSATFSATASNVINNGGTTLDFIIMPKVAGIVEWYIDYKYHTMIVPV